MWKLVFLLCAVTVQGLFLYPYPKRPVLPVLGDDYGDPLILTPYLESGDIVLAQKLAKVDGVHPPDRPVESYAGFFTVEKDHNSTTFFWYFPAEQNATDAPVVVWLQGGPGGSSLYGLFEENGPYFVKKDNSGLKMREHYWSQYMHVIYIDNPVGTGFSFTDETGLSTNEVEIGFNLYQTMIQFFKLFPNLQRNRFFITGESYAGKYIPALAHTIHKFNPTAALKINMEGFAIGDGFVDPENMMEYSTYLYQLGIIDTRGQEMLKKYENKIKRLIQEGRYWDAEVISDEMMDGDLTPYKSLFYNLTGFTGYYNYFYTSDNEPYGDMGKFLQRDKVRKAIHVGNVPFVDGSSKVEKALYGDIMKSTRPWLENLMEHYRVLLYNGQLDIICAYPLTMNYVKKMKWSGAELYKVAERKQWYVGKQLAGYSKTVKNFTEVLIRNAGHIVPQDQPLWALDLIKRFTYNEGL